MYSQVLLKLSKSKVLREGNLDAALKEITRTAANLLKVERVGIWLINKECLKIDCIMAYQKSLNQYTNGQQLDSKDYPHYLKILEFQRPLAAEKVTIDSRTHELSNYWQQLNITSTLDTPLWQGGEIIGICCCEHIGNCRSWSTSEKNFISSIGDFITIALEASQRAKAEEALRQSEARYRAIVEDQTDLICRFLPDTTLTFVNPAYCQFFGLSAGELIGKKFIELVPESEHDMIYQNFISLTPENPTAKIEHFVVDSKHNIRRVSWVDRAIFDRHHHLVEYQSVGRDITDQNKLQIELKKSEERYRIMAENATDVICQLSDKGEFCYVSPSCQQMWGYKPEELIGRSIYEFFHPKDIDKTSQVLGKLPDTHTLAHRHRRKNGKYIWLETTYKSIAKDQNQKILAVCRDITERKISEEALAESQKFIVNITDATPCLLYVYDIQKKINIYSNFAAKDILGYTPNELEIMGNQVIQLNIHPEDLIWAEGAIQELIQSRNGEVAEAVFRIITKTRECKWLQSRVKIFKYFEDGSPWLLIGSAQDITQKKLAEEALKKSKEELEIQIAKRTASWQRANEVLLQEIVERKKVESLLMQEMREKIDAQNQLLITQERLQYLLCSSPGVVYSYQWKHKFSITFISENINNLMGYTANEFLNNALFWLEHIHPYDAPQILKKISELETCGTATCEYRFLHHDGTYRWIYDQMKLVYNSSGMPLEVVGCLADINERKQAEETQARLIGILEASPDLIGICDPKGNIFYLNSSGLKMLGITAIEEANNYNIIDFYPKQELPIIKDDAIPTATSRGLWRGETSLMINPNTEIAALQTIVSHKNITGDIEYFSFIIRDINEIKQVEKALIKSQKEFELFFSQSLEGFFFMMLDEPIIWDETVDKKWLLKYIFEHQRITRINQAMLNQYGATKQQFIGLTPRDMFADDIATGKKLWQQLFDTGQLHIEGQKSKLDGSPFWIEGNYILMYDSEGKVIGNFGVQQDVSHQQTTLLALQESEEKFRQLAKNINQVFWMTSADTKQLLYANDACGKLWNIPLAKLYQSPNVLEILLKKVHNEDHFKFLDAANKILNGENTLIEYRIQDSDGKERWIMDRAFPIYNDKKQLYRIVGIAEDITERKEIEEQIQASLHEKELLLKEIHHRVKNNMQVMSSLLSLQSQYLEDTCLFKILEDSQNRIQSMALIHEKLYQSKNFSTICFREYINDLVYNLFQAYDVSSEAIKLHLDIEDVSVGIDTSIPCGLIINELISNSLKYAFTKSGRGEIHLSFHKLDEIQYQLIIQDNGCGIPEGIDFLSTDSLGLRLVRMLTYQLDGSIDLEKIGGTKFTVVFSELKYKARY